MRENRLFISLDRARGLTWLAAADHAQCLAAPAFDTNPQPVTPQRLVELCDVARTCSAVVGWHIRAIISALAAYCGKYGIDSSPLKCAVQIAMTDLNAKEIAPATNARDLSMQYFSIDLDGLLPPGSTPSEEQWMILHAFERGFHLVCRAVAGAGKTSTLLMCTRRVPRAAYLLLTYNKQLQLDAAKRARPGTTVLTYHAAAGRCYGRSVPNDEIFAHCVKYAPETPLRFKYLFIDEAQDMTLEYFALVRYLIRANPDAQVIVVGDSLQAINEYKGARPEFLTEAARLYSSMTPGEWCSRKLSISHRLTPKTAAFVNNHLYGESIIVGGNTRAPDVLPLYITGRTKDAVTKALAGAVQAAVAKYGADGVFVLAPSVRNLNNSKSPLSDLVRRHLAGVPTFVAGQEDATIDADLIRGKLAIMSFNSAKGCERRCVIVVGADETYFDFFDKTWDKPDSIPNVVTVAATRASEQLVLVVNSQRTLRTINYQKLSIDANVQCTVGSRPQPPAIRPRPPLKERPLSVTDLVRHLHPETIRVAMDMVLVLEVTPGVGAAGRAAALKTRAMMRPPPNKIRFDSYFEDLGFVYGIIAPVLAEIGRTGTTAFGVGLDTPTIVTKASDVRPFSTDITQAEYDAYPAQFWEMVSSAALTDVESRTMDEWGRLAVARHAIEGGHHHLARQVSHYNWIESAAINDARDTILAALQGVSGAFEVRLPSFAVGANVIVGRADFIEDASKIIWEFKNASEFREEYVLQLACYLALAGGGDGILLSVLRREAWQVSVAPENAQKLLHTLAGKARGPVVDIFTLIDQYDSGKLSSNDMAIDEPAQTSSSWSLDDLE
jgi:hypothetical protein